MAFQIAEDSHSPPTPFSYWVVPSRLLAGAYPGHSDSAEHVVRIHTLIDAGIRVFVNLMEDDEANDKGQPFVPYDDVAAQRLSGVMMHRHAIGDLSIPTPSKMNEILDLIDSSLNEDAPVYVHCWGGVGRTGTVVGCWLLRHGLAEPSGVLEILQQLRQKDLERGHRESPETHEQRQFVRRWLEHEVKQ